MQRNHITVLIFPINTVYLDATTSIFKVLVLLLMYWTSTDTVLQVQDTSEKGMEVGVAG